MLKIKIIIYKIFLSLAYLIPDGENRYFHRLITFILKDVMKYRKAVILDNLAIAFPEKSQRERHDIAHKYYAVLARYIIEIAKGMTLTKEQLEQKVLVTTPNILEQMVGEKQKFLILDSHFGNWEYSSILLPQQFGVDGYAIYKPLNNKAMDVIIKEKRSRFNGTLVAMNDILRHLQRNGPAFYIIIADQSPPSAPYGTWFDFFGRKTLFYNGAEKIANRYKLPCLFKTTTYKNGKYYVSYEKLEGNNLTEQYVNRLEQMIRHQPENWLWSHRRWKVPYTTPA